MSSRIAWDEANQRYLSAHLALVRYALERHIARQRNVEGAENEQEVQYETLRQTLENVVQQLPAPSTLDNLCTAFNLSPFERDIVLLCAGMELDSRFVALCVAAQGRDERVLTTAQLPTFGLALAALAKPHWDALTPDAPLRHWQLITLSAGSTLTSSGLRIDERILHYLTGISYLDERLASIVTPFSVASELVPSHVALLERLIAAWKPVAVHSSNTRGTEGVINQVPTVGRGCDASQYTSNKENGSEWRRDGRPQGPRPPMDDAQNMEKQHIVGCDPCGRPFVLSALPLLQLCGEDVRSKHALATRTCNTLGLNLHILSADTLPRTPTEIETFCRLWQREAILSRAALLLDCDELDSSDLVLLNVISRLISRVHTPLLLSSRERLPLQKRMTHSIVSVEVQKPNFAEQQTLWQRELAKLNLNGQMGVLASQFSLGVSSIQSASAEVLQKLATTQEEVADPAALVWEVCRLQARAGLDELALRLDTQATWHDLVLPEAQRHVLHEIVAHVRQRATVYETWGFRSKGTRGLGISVLFAGASGTGKTLAAEVLASELHLDLYRIDLSSLVSKYIGETEKNLRRVFDAAEEGGAILLFDEADALFGKRSEVKDSHDRYANIEVSYLLQRMESYHGLAILTTNLKSALDTAFLRRIRFIVQFPFPDAVQRAEIWRRIFPHSVPLENVDVQKLAQLNVAGGNIRNIALNAAFLAADAREPVRMSHLLQASSSEYAKLEKPLTSAEIGGWV